MTLQTKNSEFKTTAEVIPFPSPPARRRLKRPPTLARAAAWRARRYVRERDLPRLASGLSSMRGGSEALLARLREIEEECWRALREGAAAHYDAERHVLALAALMAEGKAAGQSPRR